MYKPLLRGNRGIAILPAIFLAVVLGGIAIGITALHPEGFDPKALQAALPNANGGLTQSEMSGATSGVTPGASDATKKDPAGTQKTACKAGHRYDIKIVDGKPKINDRDILQCESKANKGKNLAVTVCYEKDGKPCGEVTCQITKRGIEFYAIDPAGKDIQMKQCTEGEEVQPKSDGVPASGGAGESSAQGPCPDGKSVGADGSCSGSFQGPCPNGQTVNASTGQCNGTAQGPCPDGTTVDPNTGMCGSAYQGPCQNGKAVDPQTGTCSNGYQGPCPNGKTMDSSTGQCVSGGTAQGL